MFNLIKIKVFLLLLIPFATIAQNNKAKSKLQFFGSFTDDYKSKYIISDSIWIQNDKTKYHIIKWNTKKQYILAKNDSLNKADAGKYTRIDYMTFNEMEPWLWGYCYTVYNAKSDRLAKKTASADRKNPKKGCNGYPFSRMKKTEL